MTRELGNTNVYFMGAEDQAHSCISGVFGSMSEMIKTIEN